MMCAVVVGRVTSYLPHCLSKIDRVSFGLLGPLDTQAPSSPHSRRLMAVPFVGKDVPSRSSEFAHPDVLVGLTVLAYRSAPHRVCLTRRCGWGLARRSVSA